MQKEHIHSHTYMPMEQPVFIVDFLHLNGKPDVKMAQALSKAIQDMGSLEIHNVQFKLNDPELFSSVISKIDKNSKMNISIQTNSDVVPQLVELRKNTEVNFSIACKININEIEKISSLSDCEQFVISCDNTNLLDMIKWVKDVDKLKTNAKAVIISPTINIMQNQEKDGITWEKLDDLYRNIIDLLRQFPDNKIYMDFGILPTRLLTEHPCNGYVCSHNTCHSSKNNLPRRLYLHADGKIIPEHSLLHKDYEVGNIYAQDFLTLIKKYVNSPNHKKFLVLARTVYTKWIQTTPYRAIPWSELLFLTSHNLLQN